MKLEKNTSERDFPSKGPELRRVLFILFGQKSYASSALYLIGSAIASPIEGKQSY